MRKRFLPALLCAAMWIFLCFTACRTPQASAEGALARFIPENAAYDAAADCAGTHPDASPEHAAALARILAAQRDAAASANADYALWIIPPQYQLYRDADSTGMTIVQALSAALEEVGLTPAEDMTALFLDADPPAYDTPSQDGLPNAYGLHLLYQSALRQLPSFADALAAYGDPAEGLSYVKDETESTLRVRQMGAATADFIEKTPDGMLYMTELSGLERVLRPTAPQIAIVGNPTLLERLKPTLSAFCKRVCAFADMPSADVLEAYALREVLVLLDTETILALKPSDAPAQTDFGTLRILKQLDARDCLTGVESRLLCGACTPGSTVTITGDQLEPVTQFCPRERFFIPVRFRVNQPCTLLLTETDASGSIISRLTLECDAIGAPQMTGFTLGSDNFIHWPDANGYLCGNYPSERGMQGVYNALKNRFARIREACGADTKFMVMVMPDPLVLYNDSTSAELDAMRRDAIAGYNRAHGAAIDPDAEMYTSLNALMDYIKRQNPDFHVVDMGPILRELRKNEDYPRLYHTTDNHWSSYGAYFGYREVMSYVYESSGIEATRPLELSDFDIVDYHLSYPNQLNLSDPAAEDIYEVVDLLEPKIPRTARLTEGTILGDGRFWSDVRGAMRFTTGREELPDAVFLRDSFTTALYPLLNEHFNNTYYGETWNYSLDYDWLRETDPDYVFVFVVERLAANALNQR